MAPHCSPRSTASARCGGSSGLILPELVSAEAQITDPTRYRESTQLEATSPWVLGCNPIARRHRQLISGSGLVDVGRVAANAPVLVECVDLRHLALGQLEAENVEVFCHPHLRVRLRDDDVAGL